MARRKPYRSPYSSEPIEWQEFLVLLDKISAFIETADAEESKQYAAMQTIVALGGFLGIHAVELLNLKWVKVYGVEYYLFWMQKHRAKSLIEPRLSKIIATNYELVNPDSIQDRILKDCIVPPFTVMTPSAWNDSLYKILKQFGVHVDNPGPYTLSKTYARHKAQQHDFSPEILRKLSHELGIEEELMPSFVRIKSRNG